MLTPIFDKDMLLTQAKFFTLVSVSISMMASVICTNYGSHKAVKTTGLGHLTSHQ